MGTALNSAAVLLQTLPILMNECLLYCAPQSNFTSCLETEAANWLNKVLVKFQMEAQFDEPVHQFD
jgi:hypothetical protein